MAVISSKDLDRRMEGGVDLSKADRRDRGGTGEGAMEGVIPRGSEHQVQASLSKNRGAPVYEVSEIAPDGFYGSQTVISVRDSEALDAQLDPAKGKVLPPLPYVPVAASPLPAPVATATKAPATSAAELLARMGIRR